MNLVLICQHNLSHPEAITRVLGKDDATELLEQNKITLAINPIHYQWKLTYGQLELPVKKAIGTSHEFSVDGPQRANYLIGVYDSENINHMQKIIDGVINKEKQRCVNADID